MHKACEIITDKFRQFKKVSCFFVLFFMLFIALTNLWISFVAKEYVVNHTPTEPRTFAIVLGAGVRKDNLSGALRERMLKAIKLFEKGIVQKILVTGDGTGLWYNETEAMLRFALSNKISSEFIFADEEGYSTYLSLYRAKQVFNIKDAYIISQNYHLARSVFIANSLGINAIGVISNTKPTALPLLLREIIARTKDFIMLPIYWYL